MVEINFVDKSEIPSFESRVTNKWIEVLNSLPDDKAIKVHQDTHIELYHMQSSILGAYRRNRHKEFRVKTKSLRNPDSTYELFIWKEPIE